MQQNRMADWAYLEAELSLWAKSGRSPRLWWRDDDAQDATPALEPLLELSERHAVPVHLSVIPDGATSQLAARLHDTRHAYVLQHGLRHVNHEPPGLPASEVGQSRDLKLQEDDLKEGWQKLVRLDLPRLYAGLVPPWNRIGDPTRLQLPQWGYTFLSAYEGRGAAGPVTGLTHIDAHLDPIRWKYDRVFRGEDKMLAMLLEHLRDRRAHAPERPIGLVTHHLQTSAAIWSFTDMLLARTKGMWVTVEQMEADI